MQIQLSTILPIIVSLVALLLPGLLKRDAWALTKPWLNGLISGVVVAVFAALAVWVGGNFSPNVLADWALFVAAYSALLAGPLAPLDAYLQSVLNLPFLKPAPANANPVRVPTALTLPRSSEPPQGGAASIPVPPRASVDKPTPSA